MPSQPKTAHRTALESLLSEITRKKTAMSDLSDQADGLTFDELETVVRHCVETDAVLTVAQAIILTHLDLTTTSVQS